TKRARLSPPVSGRARGCLYAWRGEGAEPELCCAETRLRRRAHARGSGKGAASRRPVLPAEGGDLPRQASPACGPRRTARRAGGAGRDQGHAGRAPGGPPPHLLRGPGANPRRAGGLIMAECPTDLSIIIVNWNTLGMLRDCLASVRDGLGDVPAEVIVIDNASEDGSADMVAAEFPEF